MKLVKVLLVAIAVSAAFSSCLVVREPYHHEGYYHHYGYYDRY